MLGSFFKPFNYITIGLTIIIVLITCLFGPIISNSTPYYNINCIEDMEVSSYGFIWPTPGYTKINSYFGKRTSPTAGASTYHKGIDIGAPENSILIAVIDGTITFTGFLGGGGYTITLSRGNMKITYCHVSPNYIVEEGNEILQGQVIGFVGPKNVYGVIGNTYKDNNGNPTNGATTGAHLHLGIRINDEYQDPLNYYD